MTSVKRTDSMDTDFQLLVAALDNDLAERDGAEHGFYHQFNAIAQIREAVVIYSGNEAIGCGAFKPYDEVTAEIKRMYIKPEFRGKGSGLKVLEALEAWAKELNYRYCILETGKKQPEAIRLYQKAGYLITPNYGQYENVKNSVCMKKSL